MAWLIAYVVGVIVMFVVGSIWVEVGYAPPGRRNLPYDHSDVTFSAFYWPVVVSFILLALFHSYVLIPLQKAIGRAVRKRGDT
jgi:hypothetical protein